MSVDGRPLARLHLGRLRLDAGDAVFAGTLVAAILIPLRLAAGPPAERALPEVLSGVIDAGILWLLLRAAATPGLDGGSARAFRLLAAGRFCALVGNVVWYVDELRGVAPAGSLSLLPFVAYYAFLLTGVLSFPLLFRTAGERMRFWLDTLAVLAGGALVLLLAVGERRGGTPAEALVFATYALGDLVLLLAAALLLLRRDPRFRTSFVLLAGCLLLTLLGDTLAAVRPLGADIPELTVPLLVRTGLASHSGRRRTSFGDRRSPSAVKRRSQRSRGEGRACPTWRSPSATPPSSRRRSADTARCRRSSWGPAS